MTTPLWIDLFDDEPDYDWQSGDTEELTPLGYEYELRADDDYDNAPPDHVPPWAMPGYEQ